MLIGSRLRQLREQKHMSQGDIEDRIGLLRCYISRVENGHTVPSLETLERFAAVLDVPLYQLFYCGEEAPPTPSLTPRKTLEEITAENGAGDGGGCSVPGEAHERLDPSGRAGSGCRAQFGQEISHSLTKPLKQFGTPLQQCRGAPTTERPILACIPMAFGASIVERESRFRRRLPSPSACQGPFRSGPEGSSPNSIPVAPSFAPSGLAWDPFPFR